MALSRAWRWAALVLLALALLVAAAYWFLDAWLTGAGGRGAVERALSERVGMPVRLRGEFAVTLLPLPGVGGTDLAVGADGEVLRAREYGVSLALRPLLDKQLVIESVALADGAVDPSRWADAMQPAPADHPPGDAGITLPEIRALSIRNFDWLANGEQTFRVSRFRLDDFAPGQGSPFELDIDGVADLQGQLQWLPVGGQLDGQLNGQLDVRATAHGNWPGSLRLQTQAELPAARGRLDAQWQQEPDAAAPQLSLGLDWALADAGLALDGIALDAAGQSVVGAGCLLTADAPALHLELSAERLVLDPLLDLAAAWPGQGSVGGPDGGEWPLALHLRLRVAKFSGADATAEDAVLQVGGAPDCPDMTQ